MDNRLKKILDDNVEKFSEWTGAISEYNTMFNSGRDLSQDEQVHLCYKAAGVLGSISELYIKYGAFKDNFDCSKMFIPFDGIITIIKSSKTGCEFNLGFDNSCLYIETSMKHPENLRYMNDGYYRDLLSLMELGDFKLQENEQYGFETTKRYEKVMKNNQSKIFTIMRNYFIGIVENEKGILLGNFDI